MNVFCYFSYYSYWAHAIWCRRKVEPGFDIMHWGAELETLGDRMAAAIERQGGVE